MASNGMSAIIFLPITNISKHVLKLNLINFVLFQIGWFACVISAAAGMPWIGVLIGVIIVCLHIWRATEPTAELSLVAISIVIGALWDSILVWQEWLSYTSGYLLENTAPIWIITLWALFATTLNISLRWLKNFPFFAILLGGVAGPLAYLAGVKLGAVSFSNTTEALIILAMGWALITPLLLKLAIHYDGYQLDTSRLGS